MKTQKIAVLFLAALATTACGGGDDNNALSNTFPAPTGVQVAVVTDANNNKTFNVTWNLVSDAVSYNIYMASEQPVTKLDIANLAGNMSHIGLSDSLLHDLGLDPDTTFYFVVTAVKDTAEETAESCEVSGRISGATGGETCGQ